MTRRETFVLRLVRIPVEQEWRLSISLRNIRSGEERTFDSAQELARYLAEGTRSPGSETQDRQQE